MSNMKERDEADGLDRPKETRPRNVYSEPQFPSIKRGLAELSIGQAQADRLQAHIKTVSSVVVSRYSELFPNYAYTDDQSAVDLMAAEVKAARAERDRLQEEVDAEKRYSLLLAQRIIELQAEVDKWTRMAECAGFDKTGLLAVGEELQKRDQQLADQRAAIHGLVEALTEMLRLTSRGTPWYDQMPAAKAQANAAIAAVEKITQPPLVFDLDKAERIGEQLTRDSPVVNGPAKVEP